MDFIQILIITTLSTNAIVLIMLFTIFRNQQKMIDIRPFMRQIDMLRKNVVKQEEINLKKALDRSRSIINQTLNQMKGVENLSRETKHNMDKKADKLVRDTISNHSEVFKNTLNEVSNSYKSNLQNLENVQRTEYEKIMQDVRDSATSQIQKMREDMLQVTQEERTKVQEEMNIYKEKLERETKDNIFLVVSEVARETIGESIDVSKHEELVLKALEKAKKEKMF